MLTFVYGDQDGVIAAAPAAVTVGVVRGDGTQVLAAGTATVVGTPTGVYTVALTAAQAAALDSLTATWAIGATVVGQTRHEVVGAYYVSLADIRATKNLGDAVKFPNPTLIAARSWFESTFEAYTNQAWVPRYNRCALSGLGRTSLMLDHLDIRRVRSVRIYSDATTYTAYTQPQLDALSVMRTGELISRLDGFPIGSDNIVIEYEHGPDRPPRDVCVAAKMAIEDYLLNDNAANRQYSLMTEAGIVRNSTPGADRPFGIPYVDEVANRRRLSFIV